jgi:hypothetical protein
MQIRTSLPLINPAEDFRKTIIITQIQKKPPYNSSSSRYVTQTIKHAKLHTSKSGM